MYKKSRFTFNQRKRRAIQIGVVKSLDVRRRRLFNSYYRKSVFYLSSWLIRFIYIFLFIMALLLNNSERASIEKEVVLGIRANTVEGSSVSGFRARNMTFTAFYLETGSGTYIIDIYSLGTPNISVGDTVLIEKNVLGKSISITKASWRNSLLIRLNIIPYFLVFFVTIISVFFNDGLERFTSLLLGSCMVLDTIAVLCYFISG